MPPEPAEVALDQGRIALGDGLLQALAILPEPSAGGISIVAAQPLDALLHEGPRVLQDRWVETAVVLDMPQLDVDVLPLVVLLDERRQGSMKGRERDGAGLERGYTVRFQAGLSKTPLDLFQSLHQAIQMQILAARNSRLLTWEGRIRITRPTSAPARSSLGTS